ncbi:MAG: N-acetylglucosamine-6-phosphate deacetylase [Firmicutes bacterium]|jgi:N-acetylglucosamine-6-phosphate deacetylase|nr:N-acetylglucosamine-6-phosphate deacetylase [Bacillota bacterium]
MPGTIVVENGIITYVGSGADVPSAEGPVLDAEGAYVTPGLIDIHVHGGGGGDVMDGTGKALEVMGQAFSRYGTTGFVPATVTASHRETLRAVEAVKAAAGKGTGGAQVLGIHLEGPYIDMGKRGAHHPDHVRPPSLPELEEIWELAGPLLRLVTLAPELEGAEAAIRRLRSWDVTVAIGHSNATYEEAMAAHVWGASHICHMFNGMRGLHHREPGVAGAALTCDGFSVELICDGVHVHPAAMDLVMRAKGPDKVVLITDTLRAMGLPQGRYQLGGLEVEVTKEAARLLTGELAGSTLSMARAVKNAVDLLGVSVAEAVRMASCNPARAIGISSRKGSLTVGKDGDIAVFDAELNPLATIVGGQVVYQRT